MHILPKLPYTYDALEPWIDKETMTIHHIKHHQAYVDNLNKALDKYIQLQRMPLEELLSDIKGLPEDIRTAVQNNGGGHWNHSFFWELMSPKLTKEPTGEFAKVIGDAFGDFQKFKEQLTNVGLTRFGSGWAWLVINRNNKLEIYSAPNQDNPLMRRDRAVFGIDLWEHAYYLKYQNRRAEYLNNFWNVVNWEKVAENYERATR